MTICWIEWFEIELFDHPTVYKNDWCLIELFIYI